METRTYKVYDLKELSEKSQEKAIERIAQMNHEHYDSDNLTEMFSEKLQEWGFPTDKLEWSLSYSQGDGVAFYGSVDVREYLKKTRKLTKFRMILKDSIDIGITLERNSWGHHYSHWNTMTVDSDAWHENRDMTERETELLTDLHDLIAEDIKKVSRELEKLGYEEFERVTSKEYILEEIEANEWMFTEDGRID